MSEFDAQRVAERIDIVLDMTEILEQINLNFFIQ